MDNLCKDLEPIIFDIVIIISLIVFIFEYVMFVFFYLFACTEERTFGAIQNVSQVENKSQSI